MTFTPFEKNIEVWKQLWRVVEMSDLLIQIVDGRDPLFFYCSDVAQYVQEVNLNKGNFIIINKADFLSESIRLHWSNYLNEQKIQHIFFSAKIE